jgi:hypothetical protein
MTRARETPFRLPSAAIPLPGLPAGCWHCPAPTVSGRVRVLAESAGPRQPRPRAAPAGLPAAGGMARTAESATASAAGDLEGSSGAWPHRRAAAAVSH